MKTKMTWFVVAVLIALNLTAFAGVKYLKTWKNPEGQPGTWKGKKVLVFAGTLMKEGRQRAEQAMVRELTKLGIQAIPAYTAIPPAAEKDLEMARRILTDQAIAGALIMRVTDIRDETMIGGGQAYYMGPTYNSFYGCWGGGWNVVPLDVRTKATLVVETLVYSIVQDKLIWIGTSEAKNPEKVDQLINQLISATRDEIRKAGLAGK
jgi:hypothetical protein